MSGDLTHPHSRRMEIDAPKVPSLAVPRDGLKAGDLSDESSRTYHFASGHRYLILNPKTLYTRPGGTTHRVVDDDGTVHLVAFPGPNADTVITWEPRTLDKPVAF